MSSAKLNYLYGKLERLEIEQKELESIRPFTSELLSKSTLLQMDIHEVRFEIEELEETIRTNNDELNKPKVFHTQGDFYVDVTDVDEPAGHGWIFILAIVVAVLVLFKVS